MKHSIVVRLVVVSLVVSLVPSCGSSSRSSFEDGARQNGDPTNPSGDFSNDPKKDDPTGEVTTCEQAAADRSAMGCDFYAVAPDSLTITRGACYAAFLVNTSNQVAQIALEREGKAIGGTFAYMPQGNGSSLTYTPVPASGLPGGGVAIVFLSRSGSTECPSGVTPALTTLSSVSGTGRGSAFHIKTTAPIVAYDIYPYGGGASALTSATLLLPTSAWDKNYVAVSAYKKSTVVEEDAPTLALVAAEDATTVTINPTAAIVGKGSVESAPKNAPKTYVLRRGEILQFVQAEDLSGSAIASDKPIAVWGGSICMSIPEGNASACDTAHQQLPPVRAMGSEFAAVRYRNRFDGKEETVPWRLVGAIDGTKLTWEPSKPAGAPDTLAQGQVVEINSPGQWVVRSQDNKHPFYVSAHMTGWGTVSSAGDNRGDPEFVNVLPTAQYLKSYVFFTDPTYPETNLVVVRAKAADGFKDVELDCAGKLTGWQPLGSSGQYEYTRTDLVRGNFQKQGNCDNGRRAMKSDGLFGLTVWGWGSAASGGSIPPLPGPPGFFSQAVSYAYPAGGSLKPINDVVVPVGPR